MEIEAILERIETGMTTAEDAWVVAEMVRRAVHYEAALKAIAVQGDAEAAMKACKALAEVWSRPVGGGR